MPIIKCCLVLDQGESMAVDISLGPSEGGAAVLFAISQLAAMPYLMPPVLVIKALLKVASYTLVSLSVV